MAIEPNLKRHRDENGKPTGLYACSECSELFKPNPSDKGDMARNFALHLGAAHKGKKPREDVNQAAARVVREATK